MKTITKTTLETIKAANGKAINVTAEYAELQNTDTGYFFDLDGNYLSDRLYKIRDSIAGKSIIFINLLAYEGGTKGTNPELVMASVTYFN